MQAMKAIFVLVVALMAFAFATESSCHPQCKWQCDDPACPAVCHPICARPKCQMQCEELPCPKCDVHCEKPACSVRCPKSLCEKDDCPKCETVCSPPVCHTACIAPKPKCAPLCEATNCDWKCRKPLMCPRPKCELVCEKPACEYKPPVPQALNNMGCCPCTAENTKASMLQASESSSIDAEFAPSFAEVMSTVMHNTANGAAECCACKA
eukprot:TRINITY_DN1412_c0_g1_i7.p1 TRINITY_DN1412_c0_g1~~TRINITY_DN1412_c0_g1_i7.p1  ORF type:complete len:210 (+),score=3.11 TRINITY_DN1412_c0_g1_i7:29-658(+)